MDTTIQPVNGNGSKGESSLLPLPDASTSLEQQIIFLQNRVEILEQQQARFIKALMDAGQFLLTSPQSKVILMALPKEMKTRLTEFFANGQTPR